MNRKSIVSVIGGRRCTPEAEKFACELGMRLAPCADIVCCGGLEGSMKAVCQGVKEAGGITMGILPGYDKSVANPFVDIVIPTGLGLARNVLVVKSADVVVALPGASGTLSEIAYCLQFSIPVISLHSWDIPGVIKADSIEEAAQQVTQYLKKNVKERGSRE
ncbi:MAG TPA: TIGR00725 family protein [Candidatus Omnitrophota bacterium]|nr:TIGR00725 family protein [Candidatus Omnitrophota bacterium]HPT06981.1 TIGR00725 family protein [Candidatus Omnitrophota bacterium]